jgi:hypothetical protein
MAAYSCQLLPKISTQKRQSDPNFKPPILLCFQVTMSSYTHSSSGLVFAASAFSGGVAVAIPVAAYAGLGLSAAVLEHALPIVASLITVALIVSVVFARITVALLVVGGVIDLMQRKQAIE